MQLWHRCSRMICINRVPESLVHVAWISCDETGRKRSVELEMERRGRDIFDMTISRAALEVQLFTCASCEAFVIQVMQSLFAH